MAQDSKVTSISAAKAEKVKEFNRENYGSIIRKHRIERGLTQPQLADMLNVSKNYISNWEAGRARPDMNLVPDLCHALGITIPEFFGRPKPEPVLTGDQQRFLRNYSFLSPKSRKVIDKTILAMLEVECEELREYCEQNFILCYKDDQKACAGILNPLEDRQSGEEVYVRSTGLTRAADEIIVVSGDSMEPTFHDGDELLVQYATEVNIGEIGVFLINGEGFVKELREGGVYSHNSKAYPFRRFSKSDDVRCVGRVLGKLDSDCYPNPTEAEILKDIAREKELTNT